MTYTTLKDPDATIERGLDWSDWLADGESISTSEWIMPDGLTLVSSSVDGSTTYLRASGGEARKRYTITNRVTISNGLVDDRSIVVQVVER